MNGILLVNKPQDFTSFDIVAMVKKILSIKKVGHGGTLDPMATGVLPVFIGGATKIIDILKDQDKKYIAAFKLGEVTSTYDIWGDVISQTKSEIDLKSLRDIVSQYIGKINQVPPMFSAIKINGQRLYNLARQGIEIEREPRPVTIYDLKILSFDETNQEGVIEAYVSKGTYIRSLIYDIGQSLGVGATMTSLLRSRALGFDISGCLSLDSVRQLKEGNRLKDNLIDIETALKDLPSKVINNLTLKKILNGIKVDLDIDKNKYYKIYNSHNKFYGVGYYKENNIFKFKVCEDKGLRNL